MKINVSNELKTRLSHASMNGSIIARDILAQINSNDDITEILRGTANYFGTKRKHNSTGDGYTKVKVVFTACNKNLSNTNFPDHGNPQAPWFKENRTDMEPATFVRCFARLPEYPDSDMEYFANSICVASRISVKIYSRMQDFIEAYSGDNYSHIAQYGDSTLHNSCMRHEETARNAADFYYNFAGARILIATDAAHNILGRAIVWDKALTSQGIQVSVLDRLYYTHSFVSKMMLAYAESNGINLRKRYNDYMHPADFVVMNPIEGMNGDKGMEISLKLHVKVPASKWHKQGVPYMDTFHSICIVNEGDDFHLELVNGNADNAIASCQSTSGYAHRRRSLCPMCGRLHTNEAQVLCDSCYESVTENTLMGTMLMGPYTRYKDKVYPSKLIRKGRPTPLLALYFQLEKLFN